MKTLIGNSEMTELALSYYNVTLRKKLFRRPQWSYSYATRAKVCFFKENTL